MSAPRRSSRSGTAALAYAIVRRDRVRLAVWVSSIAAMVAVSAWSVGRLFPTQRDLDIAAAASDNPAILAFNGPAQALDTLGGQIAFQVGAPGLVIVALMSLLMTVRLTRGEEESGRLELVRSLPIGRHAPQLAAATVVGAMNVAVGVLVASLLIAQGLPVAGSLCFGAGFTLLGVVFVGVTLVTAQISDNTRVAGGIAGAVLGAAFVVRAIGDMDGSGASWASPIGWVQGARPYAVERWWPLAIPIVVTALCLAAAWAMLDRRDLGAGLVPPRPGPASAAAGFRTPFRLVWRLQRGSLVGWGAGVAATGAAYGSITTSIEDFVRDNPAMADLFALGGGDLVDAYLATSLRITTLIGAGFAVQSMLRMRGEETAGRADPVLATAVSRRCWTVSHLAVTVIGTVVVQLVAASSLGVAAALVTGRRGLIGTMIGAASAYLPAVWVVVGAALALSGLVPRVVGATWAVLVAAFVISMLGATLRLPRAVIELSPFEHVPLLPNAPLTWLPLAVLGVLSVMLASAGLAGMSRRDLA